MTKPTTPPPAPKLRKKPAEPAPAAPASKARKKPPAAAMEPVAEVAAPKPRKQAAPAPLVGPTPLPAAAKPVKKAAEPAKAKAAPVKAAPAKAAKPAPKAKAEPIKAEPIKPALKAKAKAAPKAKPAPASVPVPEPTPVRAPANRVRASKAIADAPAAARKPIAKAVYPTGSIVDAFQATQKFPFDAFQRDAMQILEEGRSVLVSAPTGSGKTIVAEFAIFLARHEGRRCIYTTPLKALSNQKFRDLRAVMGDDVGLVTGDVVINPHAPVLIMTTEILRNMLQVDPAQCDDVSQVILDEAHYIGSDGRGTVWEETIVFLGKDTRIVALSATIPNADELATWVSEVHQPMDVVLHLERPVPLEPYVFIKKAEPLFDAKGKVRIRGFGGPTEKFVHEPLSSQVVRDLHQKGMTPAIFFVFSRLGCEKEAIETIRTAEALTSPEEKARIQTAVDAAIAHTPGMLTSNATKLWLERLPSGVAPHHAGLLPPLKLLIEELFQQNLLKVVFATETLAAGINMPARTVVVTSTSKRTDEGHRMLTVSEFAQMTGRAGRRGMDKVGYGVVYASHRHKESDVISLFKGQPEPLRSRFTLNYNMVVNLTHQYEETQARRIVEQCFSQFQSNATVGNLRNLRDQVKKRLGERADDCPRFPGQHQRSVILGAHEEAKRAFDAARDTVADLEKGLRGQNEKEAERVVMAAPYNSFVVVKRPAVHTPEIAVLLDKYKSKKGVQFGALLENGLITRLGAKDLLLASGVAARGVPNDFRWMAEGMSYLQLKRVKLEPGEFKGWERASGIERETLLPRAKEPAKLVQARESLADADADWTEKTCYNCNKLKLCRGEEKEVARLQKDMEAYQKQIDAVRSRFWNHFIALRTVLERAGFIRGRQLLPRGIALANLRTQNELLAAETLASGLLEGLEPAQLCAVVCMMIAEPPRGRMAWHPLKFSRELVGINDEMYELATHLAKIERKVSDTVADLQPSIMLATEYAGLVQHWAAGFEWAHIVETSGIDEGQLVRQIRHVIDMLNQIKDVPGNSPSFKERLNAAIASVDRDIVKEVF